MKNTIRHKIIAAAVCALAAGRVNAVTDFNDLLAEGITSLTEGYDAVKARSCFTQILNDAEAKTEVVIHTHFWMAYAYLFEGSNDAARDMFASMFRYKTDPDFKYEEVLDQNLLNNGELMRMYDVEFEKFYGRPRIIIGSKMLKKDRFKADKKGLLRLIIIGAIVTTAVVLL